MSPKSCPDEVAAFRKKLSTTKKGDAVTPDADAPPWVKELSDEIERAPDASREAILLAEGMTKAIAGCAPVAKAFAAVAPLDANDKEAALRESVPDALEECHCEGVDVAALSFFIRSAMASP